MKTAMLTTTFQLDGYRVARTLGIVRGMALQSMRSLLSTLEGSLPALLNGNFNTLTDACEKIRAESLEKLMARAEALGANAVLGVRYDTTDLAGGVTEFLCYGTAVVVEAE